MTSFDGGCFVAATVAFLLALGESNRSAKRIKMVKFIKNFALHVEICMKKEGEKKMYLDVA